MLTDLAHRAAGVTVVTTDALAGHTVAHVIGSVIGVVPVERNKFANGMKALEAGDQVDRTRALLRDRRAALANLVLNAARMGANAVVGMRFDHREVSGAWMEICAYGTAVWVQPE